MDYYLYFFSIGSFLFLGFSLHLLFTKNGNTYLNKLLALILSFRGLKMLFFILLEMEQRTLVTIFFNSFDPLFYAYPACIYLYIRGFIHNENRFNRMDWIHFIPVLFSILNIIFWYTLDVSTREHVISQLMQDKTFFIDTKYGLLSTQITSFLRNLLILFYLLLGWWLFLSSELLKNKKANKIAYRWILFLLIIMSLTNLNFFITSFINLTLGQEFSNTIFYHYTILVLCSIIITILVFIFYNPKILYGYIIVSAKVFEQNKTSLSASDLAIRQPIKSKPTDRQAAFLSDENTERYKNEIVAFMNTNQPYLKNDFTLNDLAQHIGLPLHQCSQIVNCEFGENFRDWINGYRIAFFIEEYPKKSTQNTILSVALDCGFNNKVTFYNAFKKQKGVTPTDYFNS
jgi:AraC-like DNA-binding protein